MSSYKAVLMPLLAAGLITPGIASANAPWHPAATEAGYTTHLDHLDRQKTRAEVMAEVMAARKDGTLAVLERGAPLPPRGVGPAKTREQVLAELMNEPQAQRRARMELLMGG